MDSIFIHILPFSLIALTATACKTPDKSIPSTVKGLVVAENFRWPDGHADVCWKTPGFESEKLLIKTALELEYNQKTNFRFTGFYECGANLEKKIVVDFDPAVHPEANTGFSAKNLVKMFVPPFSDLFPVCKKSLDLAKVCLTNVSLHEFGHSAGLIHEQDRIDSSCDEHKGNPDSTRQTIGTYDHESIMNACNPRYFSEILSISAGDIVSINTLYPKNAVPESVEKSPRADACQRCGQDKDGKRYCGVIDPATGAWQSGTWLDCSTNETISNLCQPCGRDRTGQRFCGQYENKTWSTGVWVLCSGPDTGKQ